MIYWLEGRKRYKYLIRRRGRKLKKDLEGIENYRIAYAKWRDEYHNDNIYPEFWHERGLIKSIEKNLRALDWLNFKIAIFMERTVFLRRRLFFNNCTLDYLSLNTDGPIVSNLLVDKMFLKEKYFLERILWVYFRQYNGNISETKKLYTQIGRSNVFYIIRNKNLIQFGDKFYETLIKERHSMSYLKSLHDAIPLQSPYKEIISRQQAIFYRIWQRVKLSHVDIYIRKKAKKSWSLRRYRKIIRNVTFRRKNMRNYKISKRFLHDNYSHYPQKGLLTYLNEVILVKKKNYLQSQQLEKIINANLDAHWLQYLKIFDIKPTYAEIIKINKIILLSIYKNWFTMIKLEEFYALVTFLATTLILSIGLFNINIIFFIKSMYDHLRHTYIKVINTDLLKKKEKNTYKEKTEEFHEYFNDINISYVKKKENSLDIINKYKTISIKKFINFCKKFATHVYANEYFLWVAQVNKLEYRQEAIRFPMEHKQKGDYPNYSRTIGKNYVQSCQQITPLIAHKFLIETNKYLSVNKNLEEMNEELKKIKSDLVLIKRIVDDPTKGFME